MQAAIVGGGLAGLSAAWHLASQGVRVTLFDPQGVGFGASGVATGLLHPFPGPKARRSWRAQEGMEATSSLLDVAEYALGRPVAARTGIFRPGVALETPDPDIDVQSTGLWIPSGISVYSRLYLQGLWLACKQLHVELILERWNPCNASHFDAVILAKGFEMIDDPLCRHLPLRLALGQSVVCRLQTPLPCSLVGQGHVSVTEDPLICQIGSTYEHTRTPDPLQVQELLAKVARFFPSALTLPVMEVRWGIRIAPKDGHIPIVEKVGEKIWVFTALGSRGMLYHALLGKELAQRIVC